MARRAAALLPVALLLGLAACRTPDAAGRHLLQSSKCSSSCSIEVAGEERTYCRCTELRGRIKVFWDPPVDEAMDIAFQSVGASQPYLALAFPQYPGRMVPGDAVVATQDTGAANGASAQQYKLMGEQSADVVPENSLDVTGMATSLSSDGVLACSFSLASSGHADLSGPALNVIAAGGRVAASGALLKHPWDASGGRRWWRR